MASLGCHRSLGKTPCDKQSGISGASITKEESDMAHFEDGAYMSELESRFQDVLKTEWLIGWYDGAMSINPKVERLFKQKRQLLAKKQKAEVEAFWEFLHEEGMA
jgi:hypothetical protein